MGRFGKGARVLLAMQLLIIVHGFPLEDTDIDPEIAATDLLAAPPLDSEATLLEEEEPPLNSEALLLDALTSMESDEDALNKDNEEAKENDEDAADGEYTAEENIGNPKVVEGDIYLDRNTELIMKNAGRDAITNTVRHWPGARVPYVFGSVNSRVRSAFRAAIKEYNAKTCVRFVPRRSERNYIYIVAQGGCFSAIGRSGGRQKLSLGNGCEYKGTAIHEMMHALGFFHEQSREDRDKYISIQWGNIVQGMEYNFKKYRRGEADTLGARYDYASIMHYPKYAFTKNKRPTILARGGASIGQRNTFSRIDLFQINKLYKCRGVRPRPTKPRPTRPRPTRAPQCADKSKHCPRWSRYCNSSQYRAYMNKNCKKTCGVCGSCKDLKSSANCSAWARSRFCLPSSKYYGYMKDKCPKTCRFCT